MYMENTMRKKSTMYQTKALLVVLGFDVAVFTPAAPYPRHRL